MHNITHGKTTKLLSIFTVVFIGVIPKKHVLNCYRCCGSINMFHLIQSDKKINIKNYTGLANCNANEKCQSSLSVVVYGGDSPQSKILIFAGACHSTVN